MLPDASLTHLVLLVGSVPGLFGDRTATSDSDDIRLIDLWNEGTLLRLIPVHLPGHLLKFDLLLLTLADQEVLVLAAGLSQSLIPALLMACDMALCTSG